MGLFDALSDLNPFKKKEEFSFPPLDEPAQGPRGYDSPTNPAQGGPYGQGMDQFSNPGGEMPQMHTPGFTGLENPIDQNGLSQAPQDDHRMRLPLGENIRTGKSRDYYDSYENNPQDMVRQDPHKSEHNHLQKDIELISSKLDYLKASLEAVNQRLANIEHMTRQEMENKRWQ